MSTFARCLGVGREQIMLVVRGLTGELSVGDFKTFSPTSHLPLQTSRHSLSKTFAAVTETFIHQQMFELLSKIHIYPTPVSGVRLQIFRSIVKCCCNKSFHEF